MISQSILIVEDEPKLSSHLIGLFQAENFTTILCQSMGELQAAIQSPTLNFDVVVLDRLLHGVDSASCLQALKAKQPTSPVLILSAINTASEKTSLLDKGADDYLSKPFDSAELTARVRVLLRRGQSKFELGNIILNLSTRSVQVGGFETTLPNIEYFLLKTLMSDPGRIFSKSFLYENVWGMSADVDSNVVETTVNKVRKRLKDASATPQIKNLRNSGYWIEE